MVTAALKWKGGCSLEENPRQTFSSVAQLCLTLCDPMGCSTPAPPVHLFLDKPGQFIQKQTHHFADKGPSSQSYGFSSSHVRMWKFGMGMYTLQYSKWITNRGLLYSTGNSAQCYVAAWMGGDFRGERIHVSIWLVHSGFTWNNHDTVRWLYPNRR